jgi:hypothetical protein
VNPDVKPAPKVLAFTGRKGPAFSRAFPIPPPPLAEVPPPRLRFTALDAAFIGACAALIGGSLGFIVGLFVR